VKTLRPRPHQRLFYSYVSYDAPVPFRHSASSAPAADKYNYIVMFAGVANSYPLQEYLRTMCNDLIVIDFNDHHNYTAQDLEKITREYEAIISKDKVIFTTEKDATRLDREEFAPVLGALPVYYIPIRVVLHNGDEVKFDKLIQEYVHKTIGSR
jgi:tetraacyldisaccharide 4'-kinase